MVPQSPLQSPRSLRLSVSCFTQMQPLQWHSSPKFYTFGRSDPSSMLFSSADTFSQGSFFAAPDRQVGQPANAVRGFSPVSRRVHAGGSDFACIEEGKGEPLVFIHRSLGTFLDFAPAVRHFAHGYRAIAYSRRFHPPNVADSSDTEYTMARHADDLAAVLRVLQIVPAHIVGSSWGAYVALFLALRQPDLARTLVLGEPPILPLLRRSPGGRNLLDRFQRGNYPAVPRGVTPRQRRGWDSGVCGRRLRQIRKFRRASR
jgi:pimeloyl-ACP methyl ester carboxylesterase